MWGGGGKRDNQKRGKTTSKKYEADVSGGGEGGN